MDMNEGTVNNCHQNAGNKKKEDKARRRDPKSWENIIKACADMPSDQMIEYLREKYNNLYLESRKTTQMYAALEKQQQLLQRERDQAQSEHSKAVLAKARLEDLCRELQKQNKQIKDVNAAKMKEDDERRRQVSAMFSEKLSDLVTKMEENNLKTVILQNENTTMQNKLTQLNEIFLLQSKDFIQKNNALQFEQSIQQKCIQKMESETKLEQTKWAIEREGLLETIKTSEEKNQLLQTNVDSLLNQLSVYRNQYSEIELTMSKSNQVFNHFKADFAKLNKKNTELEKQCFDWQKRYQKLSLSLLALTEAHNHKEESYDQCREKHSRLQQLCRQLSNERSIFLQQLRENQIEPQISNTQIKLEPPSDFLKIVLDAQVIDLKIKLDIAQTELGKHLVAQRDTVAALASAILPNKKQNKKRKQKPTSPHNFEAKAATPEEDQDLQPVVEQKNSEELLNSEQPASSPEQTNSEETPTSEEQTNSEEPPSESTIVEKDQVVNESSTS